MDPDTLQKFGALGIIAYLAYWLTQQAPKIGDKFLTSQASDRAVYREELREERLQCLDRLASERELWRSDRDSERVEFNKKFIEVMALVRQGQQVIEAATKQSEERDNAIIALLEEVSKKE